MGLGSFESWAGQLPKSEAQESRASRQPRSLGQLSLVCWLLGKCSGRMEEGQREGLVSSDQLGAEILEASPFTLVLEVRKSSQGSRARLRED